MTDEEKRVALRQRVLKTAKIVSLDRTSVSEVTIRNISETGALLQVHDQMAVPKEFYFLQPRDDRVCYAKAVWRREKMVGISFTSPMIAVPNTLSKFRM